MNRVRLQYNRLQRHFSHSVSTYDEVSLIDLAHTLRIWNEMAPELPRLNKNFDTERIFSTASPVKTVKRKIKKYKHLCIYFPDFPDGGITTSASNGSAFKYYFNDEEEPTISSGILKYNEPDLCVYQMIAVHCEPDDHLFDILGKHEVKKTNLENWFKSECVRINTINMQGDLEIFVITRECLVKRLANVYEASHSSLVEDTIINKFDYPINILMKYHIGGLPLPYFAVLKIANDILVNVPKITSF